MVAIDPSVIKLEWIKNSSDLKQAETYELCILIHLENLSEENNITINDKVQNFRYINFNIDCIDCIDYVINILDLK